MMTDPISDMLARIRNAQAVGKTHVCFPYSNIKFTIAKILEKEGFLETVEKVEEAKIPSIRVKLGYEGKEPKIRMLRRVSRPGRRVYAKSTELPRVMFDFGFAIVSTPNGLMTNRQARARRLGGEIICEIS